MLRNFFSKVAISLAGAALLTVTGCGGSTNSSTATTSVQTAGEASGSFYGLAKAAPVISSTSPHNGQLNVPPAAPISVTFNTNINLMSITPANFKVERASDNALVAGTFTINGVTVTFTPTVLELNTQYRVTLSQDITSSTNGTMPKGLVFLFSTTSIPTPLQLASHYLTDTVLFGGATYSYEDISATGTDSGVMGDDNSGAIPIGFTFNLFGTNYTTAYVSTNGYLTFGSADYQSTNYLFPSNDGIPRIAAWFDDLYIDGPAHIWYQVKGVAPNRYLIVQWNQVRHFNGGSGGLRGDFEIILYEGDNKIKFQYLNTSLAAPNANGSTATVGVNKGDGVDNCLFSYNSATLSNGYSVGFTPMPLSPGGLYSLSAVTPLNGAVNVSRTLAASAGTAFVFFNKSVTSPIPFTLNETSSGAAVPGAAHAYFFGGSTGVHFAGFALSGPLAASTKYTATISNALTATDGTTLATPITWSFTTGL